MIYKNWLCDEQNNCNLIDGQQLVEIFCHLGDLVRRKKRHAREN
jgi:hypothetical protein